MSESDGGGVDCMCVKSSSSSCEAGPPSDPGTVLCDLRPEPRTLYVVLGVELDATAEDIRLAYCAKALECHPDKGGSDEAFQELEGAYDTLKDADKRAAYDSRDEDGDDDNPYGDGEPQFYMAALTRACTSSRNQQYVSEAIFWKEIRVIFDDGDVLPKDIRKPRGYAGESGRPLCVRFAGVYACRAAFKTTQGIDAGEEGNDAQPLMPGAVAGEEPAWENVV